MKQSPIPQDAAAGHPVAAGLYEAGTASRLTLHTTPRNALVIRPGRFCVRVPPRQPGYPVPDFS